MKKCIGIISWLPDDPTLRQTRLNSLNKTLSKVFKLFDLPVIIIAQNWQDSDVNLNDNCIIYRYDKLGILNARKKLREKFLESEYEYLIMLDDDCYIEGTSAAQYLQHIDNNPNKAVIIYPNNFKLFAISKSLYNEVPLIDVDPEKGECNEDYVYYQLLLSCYYDKIRVIDEKYINLKIDIQESFTSSTWCSDRTRLKYMADNNRKYIKNLINTVRKERANG